MTGNQNAGIFADTDINFCDFRIAVGFSIGFVEKCHAVNAEFSCFKSECYKVVRAHRVIKYSAQCLLDESVYFGVILHKCVCVL